MNERDVEISKREAKKKERRSRKDKLAIEKRILRLSFMGSGFGRTACSTPQIWS